MQFKKNRPLLYVVRPLHISASENTIINRVYVGLGTLNSKKKLINVYIYSGNIFSGLKKFLILLQDTFLSL